MIIFSLNYLDVGMNLQKAQKQGRDENDTRRLPYIYYIIITMKYVMQEM